MNKIILKMVDSKNIYGTMNGASVRYTNLYLKLHRSM